MSRLHAGTVGVGGVVFFLSQKLWMQFCIFLFLECLNRFENQISVILVAVSAPALPDQIKSFCATPSLLNTTPSSLFRDTHGTHMQWKLCFVQSSFDLLKFYALKFITVEISTVHVRCRGIFARSPRCHTSHTEQVGKQANWGAGSSETLKSRIVHCSARWDNADHAIM